MFKVMVVDDESLTREYLKKIIPIIDSRWQVVCDAMDGQEALDLLETTMVDLIITDIKMPVMDGLQLSKQIYNMHNNIKIVILSGHEEFSFAKEAIKYGVMDYLLKPLVKEDLRTLLNKLACDIQKNKNSELAHISLLNKSEESTKLVIKNYLKAIVSESSVEIKTLSKSISKINSPLIKSKAVLLLLHINEYSILSSSTQISEMPLYKFLLTEVCEDVSVNYKNTITFLDKNENTVILVNIDYEENYIIKCKNIFENISKEFHKKTGLTLFGGIGEPESNTFLLKNSYMKAIYTLECVELFEDNYLSTFEETIKYKNELKNIKNIIYSIVSGILNNDEKLYSISLRRYVDNIPKPVTISILKHCIFLINSLKNSLPNINEDQITNSLVSLKIILSNSENTLTKEFIYNILMNLLQMFAFNELPTSSELKSLDIINKAKQYIYAHYSEPISLELIANKISISYSYLSSVFHKSEGESYIKFLTRVRMEEAAKIIETNPSIKIYDVAEKVGYVNVKHFSCTFKNYFNVTPGEYLEIYYKKNKAIKKS